MNYGKLFYKQTVIIIAFLNIFYCMPGQNNESFTDVDGNKYKIITIVTQKWLGENFKAANAPDGYKFSGVYAYDDDIKNINIFDLD